MHTDWRAHSIFDVCVAIAVGVGNVRRTVYKYIGLGLIVRVGKSRHEKFRIMRVRLGKVFWLRLAHFMGLQTF